MTLQMQRHMRVVKDGDFFGQNYKRLTLKG